MPKGRHLKPDFFTDKHVVSVSPLARLLYQGLWCHSADCGHLDDEPVEFKMRILPADQCDVDELLDELVSAGRIERSDGVIYVPTLRDHARVDKRYETFCDACKPAAPRREHDVNTTGPRGNARPTRREHAATVASHDVDGDGDGEVMVKGSDGDRPRKRATQLPDDWQPNDNHAAYVTEHGLDGATELAQFKDHHLAKGSTMKDWDRAFNTWLRNAATRFRRPTQPSPRQGVDLNAAMQRAIARDAANERTAE